jgi:hypothetical protein
MAIGIGAATCCRRALVLQMLAYQAARLSVPSVLVV